MTPQQQAIIFDWNGTILADTKACWQATNKTLEHLGVAPVSMNCYQEAYTVPLNKAYVKMGCCPTALEQRSKEIIDIWIAHYENGCKRLRMRRGAREVLGTLKDNAHKIAVLSNYTVPKIIGQAQRFSVHGYLDSILANDGLGTAFRKQGKAHRLKAFVESHGIKRALVVGDTTEEIEIAQAHGFISVAITDGVCSKAKLKAAQPDFMIGSLCEIPLIARKVFSAGGPQ